MILAATGHRPDKLGGYGESARSRLATFALSQVDRFGPGAVLVGMAQGWDQAVGWACVGLGIPFDAYVPFKGQELQWPVEARNDYDQLLACARRVVVVCEGGYAPWKMQRRNVAMDRDADALLALWSGSPGGTANCIQAATKPVLNVWDEWRAWR